LLGQSPPLESNPAVLQLSAQRFREAVCQNSEKPSCFVDCENVHCKQLALAMIGRGSRSEKAADAMRRFSELRRQLTPVAGLETAFVYAQSPGVDEVLERLAHSEFRTVVVQPHLLFEGVLSEQLRQKVDQFRTNFGHKEWILANPLGDNGGLAAALVSLALATEAANL
jgi:sirohydrochlorin ferrochelatase